VMFSMTEVNSFSAFTPLVGDRKGVLSLKTCFKFPSKTQSCISEDPTQNRRLANKQNLKVLGSRIMYIIIYYD